MYGHPQTLRVIWTYTALNSHLMTDQHSRVFCKKKGRRFTRLGAVLNLVHVKKRKKINDMLRRNQEYKGVILLHISNMNTTAGVQPTSAPTRSRPKDRLLGISSRFKYFDSYIKIKRVVYSFFCGRKKTGNNDNSSNT